MDTDPRAADQPSAAQGPSQDPTTAAATGSDALAASTITPPAGTAAAAAAATAAPGLPAAAAAAAAAASASASGASSVLRYARVMTAEEVLDEVEREGPNPHPSTWPLP